MSGKGKVDPMLDQASCREHIFGGVGGLEIWRHTFVASSHGSERSASYASHVTPNVTYAYYMLQQFFPADMVDPSACDQLLEPHTLQVRLCTFLDFAFVEFHTSVLIVIGKFHSSFLIILREFHSPVLIAIGKFHSSILTVIRKFHSSFLIILGEFHSSVIIILGEFHSSDLVVHFDANCNAIKLCITMD